MIVRLMASTFKLPHHLFLFLVLLLLWVLLTGSIAADELFAGAIVAAVSSFLSAPFIAILDGIKYRPVSLWYLFRYLGYFFIELIRANFDLARRVLAPSLPISPELVEIGTELKSDLGRMLLANSITLTPGTLSVDLVDDRILVHWIAAPEGIDPEQATRAIAAGFEKHIAGFLQ